MGKIRRSISGGFLCSLEIAFGHWSQIWSFLFSDWMINTEKTFQMLPIIPSLVLKCIHKFEGWIKGTELGLIHFWSMKMIISEKDMFSDNLAHFKMYCIYIISTLRISYCFILSLF